MPSSMTHLGLRTLLKHSSFAASSSCMIPSIGIMYSRRYMAPRAWRASPRRFRGYLASRCWPCRLLNCVHSGIFCSACLCTQLSFASTQSPLIGFRFQLALSFLPQALKMYIKEQNSSLLASLVVGTLLVGQAMRGPRLGS